MQIEVKLFPTKRFASAQKLVLCAASLPEETCYAKTYFYYFILLRYVIDVLISGPILSWNDIGITSKEYEKENNTNIKVPSNTWYNR